jgi:hypothetical protein
MHAKDLLVNHGGAREAVEAVRKRLPELDSETSLAFIIEAIDAINRSAFMVSTEYEEVLGVLDFIG